MKKIIVVGNYGGKTNAINGQSIRTQTIYNSLKNNVISYKIKKIDTSNKSLLNIFRGVLLILTSYKIVILCGNRGITPMLKFLKSINKLSKTTYVAIGGWLGDFAEMNLHVKLYLDELKGILVQTRTLQKQLNDLGLNNVEHFPNYRKYKKLDIASVKKERDNKVVFYSRVCEEKGTDLAIKAIEQVNTLFGYNIHLDIYGPIQDNFKEEFYDMLNTYKNVSYKGVLDQNDTLKVLSGYDFMLFPTHYEGEGFPGVILEAYLAGLPVVASNWKYNSEVVIDGKTGMLFDTFSIESLVDKISLLIENPNRLYDMRNKCLIESDKYSETEILPILLEHLD